MEQFRDEMRAVWDIVDDGYNARVALGETASQAILTLAARASHHEFPFGMGVLAHLCACTNGALTNIFPGDPSPVVLPVVNLNYPQTRKSASHRAGLVVGRAIDAHVLGMADAAAGGPGARQGMANAAAEGLGASADFRSGNRSGRSLGQSPITAIELAGAGSHRGRSTGRPGVRRRGECDSPAGDTRSSDRLGRVCIRNGSRGRPCQVRLPAASRARGLFQR